MYLHRNIFKQFKLVLPSNEMDIIEEIEDFKVKNFTFLNMPQ